MDSFKRKTLTGIITLALLSASAALVPLGTLAADEIGLQSKKSIMIRAQDLTPELPAPEFEESMAPPVEDIVPSKEVIVPPAEELPSTGNAEWIESGVDFSGELFEPDRLLSHDEPLLHYFPGIKNTGTWLWRGHWYTEQSIVAMIYVPPTRNILSRDVTVNPLIGNPAEFIQSQDPMTTDAEPFSAETGVRLTFGNIIGRDGNNRDHAIEFTFLGFFDYLVRDSIRPITPGNLRLGVDFGPGFDASTNRVPIPGFQNADHHAFIYEADLDSFELNMRMRTRLRRDRIILQPNGKWIRDMNSGRIATLHGGLRSLRHYEHFSFVGEGAVELDANGVLQGNDGSGRLDLLTHNNMFGLQIGGGLLEQYAHWHWGFKTTLGGLYNFADRKSRIDVMEPSLGTETTKSEAIQDDNMVFMSEFSFFAGWQVRPHVTLRASYDLLYYTGVAIARDNARITPDFLPINLRGKALFHAVSSGFEIVW